MSVNYDILIAIGVIFALFGFAKYIVPYLRKNNLEYYKEVKLALMLCGYAFRDDKVKNIADMSLDIVKSLESLSISPIEKHNEAVYQLSKEILDKFGLEIEEEALDLIVQVTVSLLPKTNK